MFQVKNFITSIEWPKIEQEVIIIHSWNISSSGQSSGKCGKSYQGRLSKCSLEEGINWDLPRWNLHCLRQLLQSNIPSLSINVGNFSGYFLGSLLFFSRRLSLFLGLYFNLLYLSAWLLGISISLLPWSYIADQHGPAWLLLNRICSLAGLWLNVPVLEG